MDFTTLYSTRIQKNFDEDQADILNTFREKAASRSAYKLTLINYYKGLPILYPAKVVAVERGTLDLDCHPQQAVAIEQDRYTLISSPLFKFPIAAQVQYVNSKKHAVTLNKLCYVEIMAEKRNAVRLELDPTIKASIIYDGLDIVGRLVDLSVQGLAITLDHFVALERGSETLVRFMLPDLTSRKHALMKLPARLIAMDGDGAPYRCRFKFEPDKEQELHLSRYVFQRQVEVIRTLKDAAE